MLRLIRSANPVCRKFRVSSMEGQTFREKNLVKIFSRFRKNFTMTCIAINALVIFETEMFMPQFQNPFRGVIGFFLIHFDI